jgi:hypothetical protein
LESGWRRLYGGSSTAIIDNVQRIVVRLAGMTAEDFDDRDAQFTGVLAQPLKPGEDPESKLPALYEALDVSGAEELAVRYAIKLKVPGFMPVASRRRKRRGRGRPDFLSSKLEAVNVDAPGLFIRHLRAKLVRRMEVIRAEKGGRRKIWDVALCVVEEPQVDGEYNPLFVVGSTKDAEDERSNSAEYLTQLYTYRKRYRAEDAKTGHPFDEMLCDIFGNVLSLTTLADSPCKIHQMSGACTLDKATGRMNGSFELTLRPNPGFTFNHTDTMLALNELMHRACTQNRSEMAAGVTYVSNDPATSSS